MDEEARTERRGLWAVLAAQPRSRSILVPPLVVGVFGAAVTGVAVGFGPSDDPMVEQVRVVAPLLVGFVAGLVGRGPWGWVAASVGAAAGFAASSMTETDPMTGLFGGLLLSLPVLAPGYGLARILAYARRLWSLEPRTRTDALRVPLRRLLRTGVLLSAVVCVVAAQAAIALSDGEDRGVVAMVASGAAVAGSYAMYRLVDRLDRGHRSAAVAFTVVYGLIGVVVASLVVANHQAGATARQVAITLVEVLAPSLFMALAPWALVRIVETQHGPSAWPSAQPPLPSLESPWPPTTPLIDQPQSRPADPATGPVPSGAGASPGDPGRRLPSATTLAGLAAAGCLVLALAGLLGASGAGREPEPGAATLSHDAPEVEALLPASVAGRPLAAWSARGEAALRLWGMTPDEIHAAREALEPVGVDLDDVVQATAGRSDVGRDPPYLVLAHRIPSAARDLLGGRAVASAGFTRDTTDWGGEERVVGGKAVWVGSTDLLVQNEHQRGRPYMYGSEALDTSFLVITDDEQWAEEALGLLPD